MNILIKLLILFSCSLSHTINKQLPECIIDYESPTSDMVKRAKEIMSEVGVFDGHNDLPMSYTYDVTNDYAEMSNDLSKIDLYNETNKASQTTIPLAEKGSLKGQFWSIYWSCKANYKDGIQWALEQIDLTKRMIAQYDELVFVRTSSEARDVMQKSDSFKIASTMGLEGGHMIGSSLSVLRMFHELGVRYMTLTHNCDTPWATQSGSEGKTDVGLSEFGKKMIKEMNRIGMIVDLSHVSMQTMIDAIDTSTAPVMFSHSGARAIGDHKRNVPDNVLEKVKANNGVVMVVLYTGFVKPGENNDKCTTVDHVVDHIRHIGENYGYDYIGIGGDFDGATYYPVDAEDVSKYPNIIAKLIKSFEEDKVSEDEIIKRVKNICSQNVLRVWEGVEAEALKQKESETNWEWISVNDTAWDGSSQNGCKTGREWPADEASPTSTPSTTSNSLVSNICKFLLALLLLIK